MALGVVSAIHAQTQFREPRNDHLPPDDANTRAIASGDVDGDGDLDLLLGNEGAPDRLLLNDGRGRFVDGTAGRLPGATTSTLAVRLGDLDGDGDLDLVIGGYGQDRVLVNDGSGTFTDVTATHFPVVVVETRGIELVDVDGDGDLDVVTASWWYPRLYLNDGAARFQDATNSLPPPTVQRGPRSVVAGDVDGDGDPDLVIGNGYVSGSRNQLFVNDGTGTFTDGGSRLTTPVANSLSVALGDVEGDGDLDLLVGNESQQNRLYLNDGRGNFTDVAATHLPVDLDATSGVALADVDGDSDLDAVVTNTDPEQSNQLYLNDGTGHFVVAVQEFPRDHERTRSVACVDVDGDRDLDVVLGIFGQERLYLNDGTGRYLDTVQRRLPTTAVGVTAAGDIDGDGDVDLISGDRAYINDGRGYFADETANRMPRLSGLLVILDLALGDLDGDGDCDIVYARGDPWFGAGRLNGLLRNDGRGVFTDASGQLPGLSENSEGVAILDADGDGDPDLVFVNRTGQNRLYLNDGTARFTDATSGRLPADRDATAAVVAGDIDGDGDVDLIFANDGSSNRLLVNNGRGFFADVSTGRLAFDVDPTRAVVLVDADDDGDLDVFFGNAGSPVGVRNRLHLNDGTGHFRDVTTTNLPVDADLIGSVAAADFDDDGDVDLALTGGEFPITLTPQAERLYRNEGTGVFVDVSASHLPGKPADVPSIVFADVDLDGDPDLVLGSGRLYSNHHRQLDQLEPAAIGGRYRLQVTAKPGYAGAQTAVVLANVFPESPPVFVPPFGWVGVGLLGVLTFPPLALSMPDGEATLRLTVPSTTSLIGQRFWFQAVVVHGSGIASIRLTNVLGTRIIN